MYVYVYIVIELRVQLVPVHRRAFMHGLTGPGPGGVAFGGPLTLIMHFGGGELSNLIKIKV